TPPSAITGSTAKPTSPAPPAESTADLPTSSPPSPAATRERNDPASAPPPNTAKINLRCYATRSLTPPGYHPRRRRPERPTPRIQRPYRQPRVPRQTARGPECLPLIGRGAVGGNGGRTRHGVGRERRGPVPPLAAGVGRLDAGRLP